MKKLGKWMLLLIDDLLYLAGAVCVSIGISCWNGPAGLVSIGVLLIAYALLISRKK